MLTFSQYLSESSDVVPHQWLDHNTAAFNVMRLAYEMKFDSLNLPGSNAVQTMFAPTEGTLRQHGIPLGRRFQTIHLSEFGLDDNEARRATAEIFATVVAVIHEYEHHNKPEMVQLTVGEDESTSRQRLYTQFATKLENSDYRQLENAKLPKGVYWLIRRDLPEHQVSEILNLK